MAYGSVGGVAGLARMWTDNGSFVDIDVYGEGGTNPTLATVTGWLDEVSGIMDVALANQGFATPITNVTALKAIAMLVNALVADLVNAANSSGRFFTERAVETGVSPLATIQRDVNAWVSDRTTALVNLGVPRLTDTLGKNQAVIDCV